MDILTVFKVTVFTLKNQILRGAFYKIFKYFFIPHLKHLLIKMPFLDYT